MKSLSLDNWLKLDPGIAMTVRLDDAGHAHPATAADWLPLILEPGLSQDVPIEVRNLFEVAKATMAYGLLFSPLLALSSEQLFRVCEAAVLHMARRAGASSNHVNFQTNLSFLVRTGVIKKGENHKWNSIRKARNFASHPQDQMVVNPAIAISILSNVVERVNSLFSAA
jgi:hypothetical protein